MDDLTIASQNQKDSSYNIKVPVFEGHMDLLLHLIKQNKIDIYDIPISLITKQYLEYIEFMKELNLEIASEFLVMAATLIYIKSRMLLPPDEIAVEEQQEDPRAGLVQRLLEYQSFKEITADFRQREEVWSNAFSREPLDKNSNELEPELYLFDLNLFDLVEALRRILDKPETEMITLTKEATTVKDKISLILEKMEKEHTIKFEELFKDDNRKIEIIVTFLALLELIRIRLIRSFQDREFGNIWLMKHITDKKEELANV